MDLVAGPYEEVVASFLLRDDRLAHQTMSNGLAGHASLLKKAKYISHVSAANNLDRTWMFYKDSFARALSVIAFEAIRLYCSIIFKVN